MALFVYHRVSTTDQDFLQQQNCVNNYLTQHRINPKTDIAKTVVEKVSGTVKHTERKLASLLATSKQGDTIYISELSRLGRNMSDLFNIVTEACERKITIVQCKDGSTIENESIGGKALLFALSLAAEIEVSNIHHRTSMGLEARKKRQARGEKWISNTGRECSKLGRPADYIDDNGQPHYDLSAAVAASIAARMDSRIRWMERAKGVQWVRAQVAKGKARTLIIEEFNELHRQNPEDYCTRTGKPLSPGVLSRWIGAFN